MTAGVRIPVGGANQYDVRHSGPTRGGGTFLAKHAHRCIYPGISKFVGMHGSEHRRGDASWRRALATHTGPTRACGLRSVYAQCELHMLPYSCFACALRGRGCRNTVPCARQAYGVEWRVFAGRMDGGDSQPRLLHSLTLKGFNLLTSAPLSTSICAILWRPALHE